ncbi:uroporphyrinogen-III synthase [Flavobacterium seoulense]|uniref:Uroporphyrinogen III synthase n=1 Tax=Flavobacterium seoulense TaxID=1492738 RepID=A0A066WT05_9FLAO|nr:uroporphyrinogen-III synthase [Flavobacterium seoulense]KDN54124.1 uroporphyrinogen III synthase [Flavobacterium seoulense]
MKILSTKILSEYHKKPLIDVGFKVIENDFISTKIKSFELKNLNESLIFTSQNAVESILQHPELAKLKQKKVYCVGIKTKNLLEENGFEVIAYTDYASDLAEIITLVYKSESYTFFSGSKRRDTLPEALKDADVNFNEVEVYETTLTPHKNKESVDAVLFFSPSAIESYLKDNKLKNEICFCIGETTASALENKTRNIIIANQPTIEDVIEAVIEEYK